VEPGGQASDGLAPLGPAWRDVSLKYAGERSVEDRLVLTVLGGSRPHLSHWKGERTGATMPAQQPAIPPEDARALVRWILALGPRP
jgi:cytochrome c